jgi:cytochrome b subunit of formate dehydrogenase
MENIRNPGNRNSGSKDTPLGKSTAIRDDEIFVRMNLAERIQHIILIITFFVLIVTGLPLFFYEIKFLKWVFPTGRSFYIRGILHRIAAVALILNVIWHILYTIFTPRGRENFKKLLPKFRDFKNAFELLWHNLGLTRFLFKRGIMKKFFETHPYWLFETAPEFGRYNFIEKFEYWAVVWGSIVMIVSGFFMWNVEFSLSLFPLWVHNIFIIVHGYEAMLAFLAVIIWHMYNVHLNPEVFPMSKVWLNGKITGKELRTLHPLEYQQILEKRKNSLVASQ